MGEEYWGKKKTWNIILCFFFFFLNKVVQVLFNSSSLFSLPAAPISTLPRVKGGPLWPPQL